MRVILIGLALILALSTAGNTQALQRNGDFRVVGYYSYYNIYTLEYYVTDIPADYLTHLVYANIGISENGQCVSVDPWTDTDFPYPTDQPFQRLRGNFHQLQLLEADNPQLTVMMSIGGWEHSEYFTRVAASEESRQRFAASCVAFMRQYGFEGIDVDWRYPVSGGLTPGTEADRQNYTLLLQALRAELDMWEAEDERIYELSATLPPFPELVANYELAELPMYVDFVMLSAFGYEGEWSEITGHIAPLYLNPRDPRAPEVQGQLTVSGAIDLYLTAGIPAEDIVLGVAFFGQSWQNVRPNDYFGLFAPHGGIPNGTRAGGRLYYRDLATFLNSPDYTRFFDEEADVPWLYNEHSRIAISYENEVSLRYKAAFVRRMGLGGAAAFELSYDDARHTLLTTLAVELNGQP